MRYISQHCCDKTMDDKMTLHHECFSELHKTMVNKVIFASFRVGDRPNHPLDPALCVNRPLMITGTFWPDNNLNWLIDNNLKCKKLRTKMANACWPGCRLGSQTERSARRFFKASLSRACAVTRHSRPTLTTAFWNPSMLLKGTGKKYVAGTDVAFFKWTEM